VEEDRIKSAREIAMEKMASLPGLTPEELNGQREKEYAPRGVAIARRYLEGVLRSTELESELHRYQGKEAEIVRTALVSTLCEAVGLRDRAESLKAVDGIGALAGGADLAGTKQEMDAISAELEEKEEQQQAACEDREMKRLRGLGISGSAVRPNLSESEDWQQELARIESEYSQRLGDIRKRLAKLTET